MAVLHSEDRTAFVCSLSHLPSPVRLKPRCKTGGVVKRWGTTPGELLRCNYLYEALSQLLWCCWQSHGFRRPQVAILWQCNYFKSLKATGSFSFVCLVLMAAWISFKGERRAASCMTQVLNPQWSTEIAKWIHKCQTFMWTTVHIKYQKALQLKQEQLFVHPSCRK